MYVLQCLSCMTGETFTERQWPVDRLLTTHWSISVYVYHRLVSLSKVSGASVSTILKRAPLYLSKLFTSGRYLCIHHQPGKLQPSNVLISSQSHQWGLGQREVPSVSRVITSSTWHLTFNSCCFIGESERYWRSLFSYKEVATNTVNKKIFLSIRLKPWDLKPLSKLLSWLE